MKIRLSIFKKCIYIGIPYHICKTQFVCRILLIFFRLNNRSAYLSYVLCLYLERQIAIPIPDIIPITKLVKHNGPMLFLSETPIYMSDYGLIK